MVTDTWTSRDLPVLRACVELVDNNLLGGSFGQVESMTGLSRDEVWISTNALTHLRTWMTSYGRFVNRQDAPHSVGFSG